MYVRLAVAWTGPDGTAHHAGDVVDVDVVTLAELEERQMVEEIDGTEPSKIGPGPTTPPADDTEEAELLGRGPTSPGEEKTSA